MRTYAQLLARDIFRYEDVMLQPSPSAQSPPQGLVGLRRDVPRSVYPEALQSSYTYLGTVIHVDGCINSLQSKSIWDHRTLLCPRLTEKAIRLPGSITGCAV